jgi:hypothetical protein
MMMRVFFAATSAVLLACLCIALPTHAQPFAQHLLGRVILPLLSTAGKLGVCVYQ